MNSSIKLFLKPDAFFLFSFILIYFSFYNLWGQTCPHPDLTEITTDYYNGIMIKKSFDQKNYVIVLGDEEKGEIKTIYYDTSGHDEIFNFLNNKVSWANHRPVVRTLSQVGGYDWVYTWFAKGNEYPNEYRVYFQKIDCDFNNVLPEEYVSLRPTTEEWEPVVAPFLQSGGFVISWTKDVYIAGQINGIPHIVFQLFDKNGQQIGGEKVVNNVDLAQYLSSISTFNDDEGDKFVVAWEEFYDDPNDPHNKAKYQSFFKIYNSDGTPVTPDPVPVDEIGPGYSNVYPYVMVQGNYIIVAWSRSYFPLSSGRVYYRIFDLNGSPVSDSAIAFSTPHADDEDLPYISKGYWGEIGGKKFPFFIISAWQKVNVGDPYFPVARIFVRHEPPTPITDDIILANTPHYATSDYLDIYVTSEMFDDCEYFLGAGFAWTSVSLSGNAVSYKRFIAITDDYSKVSTGTGEETLSNDGIVLIKDLSDILSVEYSQ